MTFVSIRRSCSPILFFSSNSSSEKRDLEEVLTVVKLPESVIELVFEPSRANSLAVIVGMSLTTEFVVESRQRFLGD